MKVNNINNTRINPIALSLIKNHEGLSLTPYICAGGMKTIGYGHVIKASEQGFIGNQITKDTAEDLLVEDISKAHSVLYRYCQVPLTIYQEAALLSFIFNCGSGAFQASSLRRKLNRGEYVLAGDELLKFVYAKGIRLNGLVKRRQLERAIFLGEVSYLPDSYQQREPVRNDIKKEQAANGRSIVGKIFTGLLSRNYLAKLKPVYNR